MKSNLITKKINAINKSIEILRNEVTIFKHHHDNKINEKIANFIVHTDNCHQRYNFQNDNSFCFETK